jgi:hypothetical protein
VHVAARLPDTGAVFAAHSHALESHSLGGNVRCWTSGTTSWQRLASRGIWVEGCTDHLGFAALGSVLANSVLGLPRLSDWTALTHADAVASWRGSGVANVVATYRHADPGDHYKDPDLAAQIAASTHFYWLSSQQFQRVRHLVPADAHHACGPGKTLHVLRAAGIRNVAAFPSQQEWRQWLS